MTQGVEDEGVEDEVGNAPWQLHYRMVRHLYEQASSNEKSISKSNESLKQVTSVFQAKAEALPATVAASVKRELADAYTELERKFNKVADKIGDQVVSKFESANVRAQEAENAYARAANFAVWKLSLLPIGVSVFLFLLLYYFFLPDLGSLRAEERDLSKRVSYLKNNAEYLERIEGVNEIFSCPDGNVTRRCIRTDESAFGGRPYSSGQSRQPGQTTYRAISEVKP